LKEILNLAELLIKSASLLLLNLMSEKKKLMTASGREVKRTGMNDSKKSALAKLREARAGNIKRTD
jgi:hypothetical protein